MFNLELELQTNLCFGDGTQFNDKTTAAQIECSNPEGMENDMGMDMSMMMMMVSEELVQQVMYQKCFAKSMMWTNPEDCSDIDRELVREDLATTLFAERIHTLEESSHNETQMITKEALMEMCGGDMNMMPEMPAMPGMGMGDMGDWDMGDWDMDDWNMPMNRRRGRNKKNKRPKRPQPPQPEPEPPVVDFDAILDKVVDAVRAATYMDCVHSEAVAACSEKIEEVFQFAGMMHEKHEMQVENGWMMSEQAMMTLDEVPNDLMVSFPPSEEGDEPTCVTAGDVVEQKDVSSLALATFKVNNTYDK